MDFGGPLLRTSEVRPGQNSKTLSLRCTRPRESSVSHIQLEETVLTLFLFLSRPLLRCSPLALANRPPSASAEALPAETVLVITWSKSRAESKPLVSGSHLVVLAVLDVCMLVMQNTKIHAKVRTKSVARNPFKSKRPEKIFHVCESIKLEKLQPHFLTSSLNQAHPPTRSTRRTSPSFVAATFSVSHFLNGCFVFC